VWVAAGVSQRETPPRERGVSRSGVLVLCGLGWHALEQDHVAGREARLVGQPLSHCSELRPSHGRASCGPM
jgi:hypothetical protein